MAAYTYAPAPVLVETTGEFAIGVTGVLKDDDGTPVQAYDLNDSPIGGITVGPKGAHQAFKADIPNGVLDFGSVLLPTSSQQQQEAGLSALATANSALNEAVAAKEIAQAALDEIETVVHLTEFKTVSDAAYTLVAEDLGVGILFSANATVAVSLPTDAAVAYPIGGSTFLRPIGTGQLIVGAPGATVNGAGGALKSAAQFALLTATKYAANSWFVDGYTTT